MGALDGAMEIFGPFDDAIGKLETLNKVMGKTVGGGVKYLIMGWEIGPLMAQWKILGPLMMQWAN